VQLADRVATDRAREAAQEARPGHRPEARLGTAAHRPLRAQG